jgi:hypothetical protein
MVVFQFYLPYLLPRTEDWYPDGYLQLRFNIGGHEVSVHPRKPSDPLFPHEIDRELSNQHVEIPPTEIPVTDVPQEVVVRDLCYDRLEVVVYGEVSSAAEVEKEETRIEYLNAAGQACNHFLDHCRVVARDPDIRGIEWYYNFSDKTYYFLTPYSMAWCSEESGEIKEFLRDAQGEPLYGLSSGSILSPKRTPVSIASVAASITQGLEPRLTTSLLVSAKELIATDNLRQGIIVMASACEIASREYIRRKGRETDAEVKRRAGLPNTSFAERRYHLVPEYTDNRSLKTEDPNTFDLLEKTYRARNNITHEGKLISVDVSGGSFVVDRFHAHRFWEACERAVDWLDGL